MHFKRFITVIVTLPPVIFLIYKGGLFLFALFIGIVCIFALQEYFQVVINKTQSTQGNIKKLSMFRFRILAFITGLIIIWAAYINSPRMISGFIALNLILSCFLSLLLVKSDPEILKIVFKQVMGVIYIPLFLSYLVLMRIEHRGVIWIFFLLSIVFSGDMVAYYVGSLFGKHKLIPVVSPGKTVEGSIAGLVANLCTGVLFKYFFLPELTWGTALLFSLIIGLAGQAGDLFESQLKRSANLKDSGNIMPGHGGILDRIDALLFAAPVLYFLKSGISFI